MYAAYIRRKGKSIMKNIKKLAALLITAILSASPLCSCSGKQVPKNSKELRVTFFDVKKADAMVLQSETGTVVIDCGEKGDGKKIANLLKESDTKKIDYLIITHFDRDHVGGAAKVINSFEIDNVLVPDYHSTIDEYDKFCTVAEERGLEITRLREDVSFTLDDVDFTVYSCKKDFYGDDDENDFSLVTKAVHHKNTLLFTGDAMEQRLDEIMDIGECTLLKVPYHGRKLDNLGDFLDAVKPKCAVVCTASNEFASKTQKALTERKITTYATCFNGDITAVSDGSSIKMSVSKGNAL